MNRQPVYKNDLNFNTKSSLFMNIEQKKKTYNRPIQETTEIHTDLRQGRIYKDTTMAMVIHGQKRQENLTDR